MCLFVVQVTTYKGIGRYRHDEMVVRLKTRVDTQFEVTKRKRLKIPESAHNLGCCASWSTDFG